MFHNRLTAYIFNASINQPYEVQSETIQPFLTRGYRSTIHHKTRGRAFKILKIDSQFTIFNTMSCCSVNRDLCCRHLLFHLESMTLGNNGLMVQTSLGFCKCPNHNVKYDPH